MTPMKKSSPVPLIVLAVIIILLGVLAFVFAYAKEPVPGITV